MYVCTFRFRCDSDTRNRLLTCQPSDRRRILTPSPLRPPPLCPGLSPDGACHRNKKRSLPEMHPNQHLVAKDAFVYFCKGYYNEMLVYPNGICSMRNNSFGHNDILMTIKHHDYDVFYHSQLTGTLNIHASDFLQACVYGPVVIKKRESNSIGMDTQDMYESVITKQVYAATQPMHPILKGVRALLCGLVK